MGYRWPEFIQELVMATAGRAGKGFVVLTFEFQRDGALWLGRCRELGTATDGRALAGVKRELAELVDLHLRELDDVGMRDQFFQTHGIRVYSDHAPIQVRRELDVSSAEGPMVQPVPIQLTIGRRSTVGV